MAPDTTAPTSTCQHCELPATWGRTEQGFNGFVHVATGLAACPEPAPWGTPHPTGPEGP